MKKIQLAVLSVAAMLTACSATSTSYPEKEALADVKKVCFYSDTHLPEWSDAMVASFKRYGVRAEVIPGTQALSSCSAYLNAKIRVRQGLINKAVFSLMKVQDGESVKLSALDYTRRYQERAIAQTKGLQGQTDRIVAKLLGKQPENEE